MELTLLKDIIDKPITGEWGKEGGKINVLRTTNFTNLGRLDLSNIVKRDIDKRKVVMKKLLKPSTFDKSIMNAKIAYQLSTKATVV